jgi:hypothetical protein
MVGTCCSSKYYREYSCVEVLYSFILNLSYILGSFFVGILVLKYVILVVVGVMVLHSLPLLMPSSPI